MKSKIINKIKIIHQMIANIEDKIDMRVIEKNNKVIFDEASDIWYNNVNKNMGEKIHDTK